MARATVTKPKEFSSLMEESDWWDQRSLEELIAMSEPDDEDIKFIDARPKKAISMRLTESMIAEGKQAAKDLGLGYQTLFRMWLIEGLKRHRLRELRARSRRPVAGRKSPHVSRAAQR